MDTSPEYQSFLASKRVVAEPTGFTIDRDRLHPALFGFQRDIVAWACKRGRAALFEGCGMGKTFQQLMWGDAVTKYTGGAKGLLLAPLAVTEQTHREGETFGIPTRVVVRQSECQPGINITNYDKLSHFDPQEFAFVIPDESSILKSYDGKFRNWIIEAFSSTPFKLPCTATPAPNDYMELGNHAEFLGVMTRTEMLATFFTHDGGDTSKWILKGHAEQDFWRWVASWAVMIQKPSDLGYSDGDFRLPELIHHNHVVDSQHIDPADAGVLFVTEARTLQERQRARKVSSADRAQVCADMVNRSTEQWLIWCNLNAEGDEIEKLIPDAVQIAGNDTPEFKEKSMLDFVSGSIRVLVSKPSISGYGMNFQHCRNVAFVGLSDSWEDYYQAIRRCWRFGQKSVVNCHIITSSLEGAVLKNIERKERQAQAMAEMMIAHMRTEMEREIRGVEREEMPYDPQIDMVLPNWLQEAA